MDKQECHRLMKEKISDAERVLIGIGREWRMEGAPEEEGNARVKKAYEQLYQLVKDKDYFIVTTLTDGAVYHMGFKQDRIVAPCGNIHWRQCSRACTDDIWEEGEVEGEICPHCGASLTENTIQAEHYIEKGYLSMWKKYQLWLSTTLNRRLFVLELGEGFQTPTVIRWPFEKTVFFNQKSWLMRINKELFQTPQEIRERAASAAEDSVSFFVGKTYFSCKGDCAGTDLMVE